MSEERRRLGMIGRWLEHRGWYRCGVLSKGSLWSWWFRLPYPPRPGERVLDVAAKEQTRGERTIEAVFIEIGYPIRYSTMLLAFIIVAFATGLGGLGVLLGLVLT